MPTTSAREASLLEEIAELRAQLEEAKASLREIESGHVDALVVESATGPKVFTPQGLDAELNHFHGDILTQVSDAVIVLDGGQNLTYLNAAAARLYGVGSAEMLGSPVTDMYRNRWIHPDDEVEAAEALRVTGHWRGENLQVKRDGQTIHVESSVSSLQSSSNNSFGQLAVIRDITERKRAEDNLHQVNRTLKALTRTGQALIYAVSEAALLQEICRIIVEDCGHAMVWVGFAEHDAAKTVRPAAYAGFEAGYLEQLQLTWADTERGNGPTGKAIRSGKTCLCRDMHTDPYFAPWRAEAIKRGYASSIAFPLLAAGRAFGSLTLYSREPAGFLDEEVQLLAELAGELAYGLSALRMRAAHAGAEQRMRLATEATGVGIWEWNIIANTLRWDKQMFKIYGIPPTTDGLLAYSVWSEAVLPEDLPRQEQLLHETIRRQGQGNRKFRIRRAADGELRHIQVVETVRLNAQGQVEWVVGTNLDVTEAELAERTLRDSEERFQQMADTIGEVFWMSSPDGKTILYVTPGCEQLFGLKREELYAQPGLWLEALLPEDVPRLLACHADLLVSGRLDIEYRVRRPDGSLRWINDRGYASFDSAGQMSYVSGVSSDITARKQMEQALRQSEERHRLIVENASEGIVLVNAENRISFVNPAMARMLGYTIEAMLDTQFELYIPAEEQQDAQQKLRSRQAGETTHYQRRLLRKDGGICWFQVSAVPLFDDTGRYAGSLFFKTDITESRRATEALSESESRFRTLFETSGDTMVLSNETEFLDCNQAALSMFRCPRREDFLGKHPLFFSPPTQPDGRDSAEGATEMIAQALRKGQVQFDWQHRRLDGTEFFADVLLTRLELQGRPVLQGTLRDISARLAMLDDLAQAKDAAEQANRSKSLFLANMSHEIRTPMNAIMGMTELCLKVKPSEQQRNYLNKIRGASNILLHIIDDILDFSKIEAGKLVILREPFALAGIFDTLNSMLAHKAKDKGLELCIRVDPALTERVYLGDAHRLGQVLINLTGNAIKFSHGGRVSLSVAEDGLAEGRTLLHFTVQDQGIGISPEEQSRLFKPFSQADASTTRNYGGTGLGLAISRRLVELMGGRIWVDSAPGAGSSFHFTVRLVPTDLAPPALQTHSHRGVDEASLAQLRGADILLVEDVELNREVIRDMLEQAGFQVRIAVNGAEALRAVEQALPDCVLMDCQMPVMDGYQAAQRLRAQERCRNLPIIALTANAMAGDREQCLAAGMNGFVSKPVDFGELYAALLRWVPPRPAAIFAAAKAPTSAMTEGPELPELPGIDTAAGVKRVGGNLNFYLKLLRKFRDSRAGDFKEQFRPALEKHDWATVQRLPHNLKAIARTLGALRLGDLAEQLEQAARQTQTEAVAEPLERLENELNRVLAGLGALERKQPSAVCLIPLNTLVQDLDRLLEDQDTAAVDCVDLLEQAAAGTEHEALVLHVSQAIARYDFPRARIHLRRLGLALDSADKDNGSK